MHSTSARIEATRQFHYKVWGLTVWEVLTTASFTAITRDLDCVELWCGVGAVWKAAAAQGHRSEGLDLKNGVAADILTKTGFLKALELTLRLATTGMLWMAPAIRSADADGNRSCQVVRDGNAMAITAYFLFLGAVGPGCVRSHGEPCEQFIL